MRHETSGVKTETLTVSLGEQIENLFFQRQLLYGSHDRLDHLIVSTRRRTDQDLLPHPVQDMVDRVTIRIVNHIIFGILEAGARLVDVRELRASRNSQTKIID